MLLNPDKSEVLLLSRKSVAKTPLADMKVNVAGADISCQNKFKTLGVTLDSKLSLCRHVQNVIKSCNYHIRAFRHVRQYFDRTTANMVACSIVSSRLDYCNFILYNTSEGNLNRLQRVQNNLARVVVRSKRSDHITPTLK